MHTTQFLLENMFLGSKRYHISLISEVMRYSMKVRSASLAYAIVLCVCIGMSEWKQRQTETEHRQKLTVCDY